jgi:hypothetical protein
MTCGIGARFIYAAENEVCEGIFTHVAFGMCDADRDSIADHAIMLSLALIAFDS